ncbi:MAG: dirigent protein [Actinobacteria bacterium]|nr:dirigent protein [Actinomycetota bacterium]
MRKRLGFLASSVILAITGGVLMSTAASGQTVVHVVLPQEGNRVAVVDVNRDGLRLGDRIAARGLLLDESQTDQVGTAYAQCLVHKRIIDPDRGLWNCNYVLELANGEIVLQGLDPRGPGAYEMAVVGGTGAYAGANGDATFTDVGDDAGGYTDMVIRLGR